MIVTKRICKSLERGPRRLANIAAASAAIVVNLTLVVGLVDRANAFDQTVQGGTQDDRASKLQGIQISPPSSGSGAGMELTMPAGSLGRYDGNSAGAGTTLPGLGGLPKLDFGLELLYGSPDAGVPIPDQSEPAPNALTVHGSLKKSF